MRAPRAAWALAMGLGALALLGIAVRLLPLASFAVWGSDTGEYHRLTEDLLQDGKLSTDYTGWGIAYAWFPGLYSVAGAVSATTGLDTRFSLEILIPALAGLAPVAAALLAFEVVRDGRAALLAGASLAVVMPHAFATSHAMPGALGHLLLLACILLAWGAPRDRGSAAAAAIVLLALVATHHLSTYMLLLALGGMVAVVALLSARHRAGHRVQLALLALALSSSLLWWGTAPPIREQVVPAVAGLGLAVLGACAALGLLVLAWLPRARARWAWRYRPRFPAPRQGLLLVAGMFAVVLLGSAIVGFVQVPGTSVQITPTAVLWFLPLTLLLSFGFLGSSLAKFRPRGADAYGWVLALLGSFALAMAAGSTVLLPYRHAEYILEPAALLAGLGLAAGLAAARKRSRPVHGAFAAGMAALLLANAALAYPPPEVLAGFQEGTTHAEMAAVRWAASHLVLEPDGVIAADHRTSSLLFGFARLDATWEYAPRTFHAASFEEARAEMQQVHSPSGAKRVDYVFLSDAMARGLALLQWEQARPLGEEALRKFEEDPRYVPLCRSEEVAIYRVAWAPMATGPAPGPCG